MRRDSMVRSPLCTVPDRVLRLRAGSAWPVTLVKAAAGSRRLESKVEHSTLRTVAAPLHFLRGVGAAQGRGSAQALSLGCCMGTGQGRGPTLAPRVGCSPKDPPAPLAHPSAGPAATWTPPVKLNLIERTRSSYATSMPVT